MYAIVQGRVIPLILDANVEYPAVVYKEIHGGEHDETLDGAGGLRRSRFAIYATHTRGPRNYPTVLRLAEAIRLALHGFTGDVISDDSPATTIRIKNISAGPHEDRYDDPTQTYQRLQIYEVASFEPVPTFE